MKKGRRSDWNPEYFGAGSGSLPGRLAKGLDQAETLFSEGEYEQAVQVLKSLSETYPSRPEPLEVMVEKSQGAGDHRNALWALEKLGKLQPNDPDLQAALGEGYAMSGYLFLAEPAMKRYLERFPNHEHAAYIQGLAQALQSDLTKTIEEFVRSGFIESGSTQNAMGREMGRLHDESRLRLDLNQLPQARALLDRLLQRWPKFVAAWNNLSLICFIEGKPAQAIDAAQHTLALEPENVHALANLVRFHVSEGELDAARAVAEQLKAAGEHASGNAGYYKTAEALSFIGDDAGIRENFARAEAKHEVFDFEGAMLCHLTAVAEYNLGDRSTANKLWKRALKIVPDLAIAQSNFDDAKLPAEQRNGPWPFEPNMWLRPDVIAAFRQAIDQSASSASNEAVQRRMERLFREHPELVKLVPLLLERGGPEMRAIVIGLAGMSDAPELLAALRDFALGQRGSDALRVQAMQVCQHAGAWPDEAVKMWLKGGWTEVFGMNQEIHGESIDHGHSQKVKDLMTESIEATHKGDHNLAIALCEQALVLEPDAFDVQYNLAIAQMKLGRKEEAQHAIEEIHRRHPDYLFARTTLATLLAQEGQTERAKELLVPLLRRRRLHFSEHFALCSAQIQLFLAEGNIEAAESWFEMMESAHPDHPELDSIQDLIDKATRPNRLVKLLQRTRRKRR